MTDAKESWKKQRTTGQWSRVMAKNAPSLHKEGLGMVAASTKRGKLPEKLKHLIWVAVDTVATHLYAPGAILHAQEAMAHGASVAEVMDTLRLACIPSTRGLQDGYPLLAAALAKKQAAGSKGGADVAAGTSPDFMRAYETFVNSSMPGGLDARSRCLVKLAVVSNPATADREQTGLTIQQALDLGVDADEILEVMEIASLIGSHAFSITLDGLADTFVAKAAEKAAEQAAK